MKFGDTASLEWLRFGDMTAARLYEVLRFRQEVFVVEQSSPYPDLDGADKAAWHLLLSLAGGLAGCLRLVPGDEVVRLGRLAVAAAQRRRGLARLMMGEALALCASRYPEYPVALSAQTPLAPFYRGLGFAAVSPPYDDYGVPHIDMLRPPG